MYFQYGETEINYLKRKDKKLAWAIEQIGHIERKLDANLICCCCTSYCRSADIIQGTGDGLGAFGGKAESCYTFYGACCVGTGAAGFGYESA